MEGDGVMKTGNICLKCSDAPHTAECALCGNTHQVHAGVTAYLEGTEFVVCRRCVERLEPRLLPALPRRTAVMMPFRM